jgi:tetratricopeptide (TPR) repeat protein
MTKGDPLATFDRHWDYDRPAVTEARFRDLLGLARVRAEAGEPAPRLELLGQIARTLSLQRRFDAAHALLDEVDAALASLEASGQAPPARARVRALLERGRTFRSAGRRDEASERFEEAFVGAQSAGEDALAVDAAHMLAIAAGASDAAIEWNERALAMAAASDDPRARRWRGSLLNNLAWARHDRGEADAALELFREALAVREAEGTPREARIARWCVGRCLRTLGRLDEALAVQESLHAAGTAAGEDDGFVCEELAELHLAMGDAAGARPWFAHAHRLLSQLDWFVATEGERLDRLRRLAASDPDEGSTE